MHIYHTLQIIYLKVNFTTRNFSFKLCKENRVTGGRGAGRGGYVRWEGAVTQYCPPGTSGLWLPEWVGSRLPNGPLQPLQPGTWWVSDKASVQKERRHRNEMRTGQLRKIHITRLHSQCSDFQILLSTLVILLVCLTLGISNTRYLSNT